MITFLKANVASLAASLSDFLITMLLVQGCEVNVVMAAGSGTVTGGIINFLIGRHWVFNAGDIRSTQNAERKTQNKIQPNELYCAFSTNSTVVKQLLKYVLVWMGNLLLNTAGVYAFTCQAGLHYVISKAAVSLLVAFLYNYPLQKNFVFSNNW
ncbi:MAG TPA: GtrA family protein [Niastella sp.]|nr:GtrA family protein [Niastella sp.]